MNKYQEALDEIKALHNHEIEWQMYIEIATLQELVDKATPTKPIKVPGVLVHDCSACGEQIDFMPDFCGHCGQAIDWSEE